MSLDDLIQIMWASLTVERGGPIFYDKLESELSKRVRGIKDDQFETLLACFAGDKADQSMHKFTEKFLKLVLQVIQDKKDRFSLRTIVSVVWACAKIDFTNSKEETLGLLRHFATYERLLQGLPTMS